MRRALREVADVERVAIIALAALGNREDGKPFVLGRLQRVKPLGVRRILVDEPIL